MTTITRRSLTLGLGAAVAAARLPGTAIQAAKPALTGHVVAVRFVDDGGTDSGPIVYDLAAGTETTVDLPALNQVFPIVGTAYGIAAGEDALSILDAASATAVAITPAPGTTFVEPLADRGLYPTLPSSASDRYALLSQGMLVTYLVDLERATAFDLVTAFSVDDRYFQAASITPDGRRLLLGSSELVALIDLDTMKVERMLSGAGNIRSPQLSPGGTRVAFIAPDDNGTDPDEVSVFVAMVDGGDPEQVAAGRQSRINLTWISDDSLILSQFEDGSATQLSRLDLATGRVSLIGSVPGIPANITVLANGTRAIVWTKPEEDILWNLMDLETDQMFRLAALDGMAFLGPVPRESRAVLLGPEDSFGPGQAGERYAVLNTATGAVTTTVDRVVDQIHTPPVFAPDLRTASLSVTGPAGDQLWLLDLVNGDLVTIPDHLGAAFSPDGKHVLTRAVGRGSQIEIRDLTGGVVRELVAYDRGWWLG